MGRYTIPELLSVPEFHTGTYQYVLYPALFLLKRRSWNAKGDSKFSRREVVVCQCQEKGVLEHRSSLRPSERALPERSSGAFRHENTSDISVYVLSHFSDGISLFRH
jgi:hypothetical protein